MKKLLLIIATSLLLLTGCKDAYSTVKTPNEALVTIGKESITKGDVYSTLLVNYGSFTIVSDLNTKILDAEVEIHAEQSLFDQLSKLGEELRFILIVSDVKVILSEKADIKTNLERINPDFIKGSAIAPLYRLDKVKKALNLTLEQVDSIYDIANTRSATSIKNAIKKLEEQKKDIDKRIKKLKAELLK